MRIRFHLGKLDLGFRALGITWGLGFRGLHRVLKG